MGPLAWMMMMMTRRLVGWRDGCMRMGGGREGGGAKPMPYFEVDD